jgi:hypothetical protein
MDYDTGRFAEVETGPVNTRSDFAALLSAVLKDFRSGGEAEWENGTLERFLDGLAAFADARVSDEFADVDQEAPSWRLFADIVVAATGYE